MIMSESNENSALSPRVGGAVFFTVYAILFMLVTKYTLFAFSQGKTLPFFSTLLITIIIAILGGSLFGKTLSKKKKGTHAFFYGILLACFSLILGTLGVMFHLYMTDPAFLNYFTNWQSYFVVYGLILVSLFFTLGIWLIPITGLIAIYFNKHFWPTLAVIDQKRLTDSDENNK